MPTLLEQLRQTRSERAARADELNAIVLGIEARDSQPAVDGRPLSEDEQREFDALIVELRELREREDQQLEIQRARDAVADAERRGGAVVRSEPLTYNRHNGHERSYFQDLAIMAGISGDRRAAGERLMRHGQEMGVELVERARRREEREARSEQEVRTAFGMRQDAPSPFEKRINPNRTDGQGGYFVPPLWLIDEYIAGLRYGRPFVNGMRNLDLPTGTDSINIPKLSTLTTVGVQTGDASAVASQDFTDTAVTANVKTLAGQEDVAIQLLEQSPNQIIDRVVMEDLIADYQLKADIQALNGTNSAGQVQGIESLSGINSVTYTSGSPTQTGLWSPLAQAVSQLVQNRKKADGLRCWMTPRRWYWIVAGL